MNKKKLISLLLIPIAISVVSLGALVPSDSIFKPKNVNWMSEVSDETLIRNLSIPGTHDSGARHSIADVAGKCQDLSIDSQLRIGTRFFDLRLQLIEDEFQIVHSFVKQKLYFEDVIDDLASYIRTNKSEFLIISIKKEESSVDSSLGFEEALLRDLDNYKDVISFDSVIPNKVKDARGKIYIISRFDGSIGVPAYMGWEDSTTFTLGNLYVQDNYCIDNVEIKKDDIISTINYSNSNSNELVLNFTSCYLDYGFPPTYAGTTAKAINPWLKKYLENNNQDLGIVIVDFISEDLSSLIYRRNFHE